jgi:hypothetical protein
MHVVVLCNRPGKIPIILKHLDGPIRCLNLIETQESRQIVTSLKSHANVEEIDRAELFRTHSDDFRAQYIEFMGSMNTKNHSLAWWSMPFTTKDPTASSLCYDIFSFFLIVTLLQEASSSLLVISDNVDLANQVKVWARGNGIGTIFSLRPRECWEKRIKHYTPTAIVRPFLATIRLWMQTRQFQPKEDQINAYTVIASPSHPTSFVAPDVYNDVYFGPLVDYLGSLRQRALIFAILDGQVRRKPTKLKHAHSPIPIVPVEAYLRLSDIISCALSALKRYIIGFQPDGTASIAGIDVTNLVQGATREACHSGNIFEGQRMYRSAKRMAQRVLVERCIYPYENRTWEKMLLHGIREVSRETRMVGYQHATITPSHLNFFLGQNEANVTPLPDAIITTGQVTRDWLQRDGNYPPQLLKVGCALRQVRNPNGIHGPQKKKPIRNILVALGNDLDEYIRALMFLEKSFDENETLQIIIRPHPAMPFTIEDAMRVAPLVRRDFFSLSKGPLEQALEEADVVMYASSTVGLEAVAAGIPAIYLELGKTMSTDPMSGWNEFKWSANNPDHLMDIIAQIEAIPPDKFEPLRLRAREYSTAYLSPTTNEGIKQFINV